jgi:hypothetical protein
MECDNCGRFSDTDEKVCQGCGIPMVEDAMSPKKPASVKKSHLKTSVSDEVKNAGK